MAGKSARLIRLLWILASRRMGESVPDLADTLKVSLRTVYRDLHELEEAGVPLDVVRDGPLTVYRLLDADRWKFGVPLTLTELVGLVVAHKMLAAQEAYPWADGLASAVEKISATVPDHLVERLSDVVSCIVPSDRGTHAYAARTHVLQALVGALENRRVVQIRYAKQGDSASVQRKVRPYGLRPHDRGLYLVGYDLLRNRIGTFLADRIQLVATTDERYEIPPGFDLAAHFESAFGVHLGGPVVDLKARFSASVGHLLAERRWHPTQRLRSTDDGLELEMRVADTPELRAWLLSWGASVVVLAPDSLASSLALEAEATIRRYARERGRRR